MEAAENEVNRMDEFLRSRNIPENVIAKMGEDGIDEVVIAKISPENLTKYLPRYGDCLAAIAFAKQNTLLDDGSSTKKTMKVSLRDKIAAKILGKSKCEEHVRRSVPQKGNQNARKTSKKIEIGWLHQYGISEAYTQVRSPSGGGTREINLDLDTSMKKMLHIAKDLFFPAGISKKGTVNDFEFCITDQTQNKLPEETTIRQLYDNTRLKTLRFYMATSQVKDNKQNEYNLKSKGKNEKELKVENSNSLTKHASSIESIDSVPDGMSLPDPALSVVDITDTCTTDEMIVLLPDSTNSSNSTDVLYNLFEQPHDTPLTLQQTPPEELESDMFFPDTMHRPDDEQNIGATVANTLDNDIPPSSSKVAVRRITIQQQLLQVFKNPDIVETPLTFTFVNEKGQDADGVSRDAYSGFWESFLLRNTDGETYRVPILCNDYCQEEWESVGRILYKGYKDHRYFPISLAPAFITAVVHGEESVSALMLKESFFQFLSVSEKDILVSALEGRQYEDDDLLFILDRFQCTKIPVQDELNATIIQIAHKVLIQEPKYAIDSISNICGDTFKLFFPTPDDILKLYEVLKPDVSKIIRLLRASPSTRDETLCFGYLQRFIRGRNAKQLTSLLRLLTGSDIICVDKIDVIFVVRHGKGRVPSIHTCGPTLELPSTYINFPDFRSEWESIMDDKYSFEMNIL